MLVHQSAQDRQDLVVGQFAAGPRLQRDTEFGRPVR